MTTYVCPHCGSLDASGDLDWHHDPASRDDTE